MQQVRGLIMQETEALARKLAETRETLRQMVARFGNSEALRVPIERLREQERKLVQAIEASGSKRA